MYSVPGKVKLCSFLRFTKKGPKTARRFGESLVSQTGGKRLVSTNDGKSFPLPFRHSTILFAILPFRHSAVPPFRHSAIPPFRHSAIPPFRHSAIPPFRLSAIPPFRGRNLTKPRKGSMFCGKNLEIVSVRYRQTPSAFIGCLRSLIVVCRSFVRYTVYQER